MYCTFLTKKQKKNKELPKDILQYFNTNYLVMFPV